MYLTWSGINSSQRFHHYTHKLGTGTPTWCQEPWASGGATNATTSLLYYSAKAQVMKATSVRKRSQYTAYVHRGTTIDTVRHRCTTPARVRRQAHHVTDSGASASSTTSMRAPGSAHLQPALVSGRWHHVSKQSDTLIVMLRLLRLNPGLTVSWRPKSRSDGPDQQGHEQEQIAVKRRLRSLCRGGRDPDLEPPTATSHSQALCDSLRP